MSCRLHVGCLPEQASAVDIASLFEKLCKVRDVYLPPPTTTGLRRNFAIVSISPLPHNGKSIERKSSEDDSGLDSLTVKCVKTFNHCLWKGARIVVSVAKSEYYRDRLARERATLSSDSSKTSKCTAASSKKRAGALLSNNSSIITTTVPDSTEEDALTVEDLFFRKEGTTAFSIPRAILDAGENTNATTGDCAEDLGKPSTEARKLGRTRRQTLLQNTLRIRKRKFAVALTVAALPHKQLMPLEDTAPSTELPSVEDTLPKPTAREQLEVILKRKRITPCGTKTVFSLDSEFFAQCSGCTQEQIDRSMLADAMKKRPRRSKTQDSDTKHAEIDSQSAQVQDSRDGDDTVDLEDHRGRSRYEQTDSKPKADEAPQGGGKRQGFGSLAAAKTPKLVAGRGTAQRVVGAAAAAAAAALLNQEHVFDEAGEQEDSDRDLSEGDEPQEMSVKPEELAEESLNRERRRAMDLLENLLTTLPAPTTVKPAGNKYRTEKQPVKAVPEKGNAAVSADSGQVLKPSIREQIPEPSSSRGQRGDLERERAEKTDKVEKERGPFADMNKLKDIFFKEGGIWWQDEDKKEEKNEREQENGQLPLNNLSSSLSNKLAEREKLNPDRALVKGSTALDKLFIEAEKLGIDIRAKSQETGKSSSTRKEGEGTGFSFQFNLDTDPQNDESLQNRKSTNAGFGFNFGFKADAEPSPADSGAPQTGLVADMNGTEKEGSGATAEQATDRADRNVRVNIGDIGVDNLGKELDIMWNVVSAEELVATAKRFCRHKPSEEVESEWRAARDKLVIDYKRKKKDAKRKTSKFSTSYAGLHVGSGTEKSASSSFSRPQSSYSSVERSGAEGSKTARNGAGTGAPVYKRRGGKKIHRRKIR